MKPECAEKITPIARELREAIDGGQLELITSAAPKE
jgi:hypothetical protein